MLTELNIKNFATIEELNWHPAEGFLVLTGETGAGKSILIDSLEMLLGEKTSRDVIRTGEQKAYVSGVFYPENDKVFKLLNENEIPSEEDGAVLIQRELNREGRSSCRINGRSVTVSILKAVGRELVNIHGQHDNQQLFYKDFHLGYLDAFAGDDKEIQDYLEKYKRIREIKKAIRELETDEETKKRKTELLESTISELSDAELRPGEEEELSASKNRILNFEKIHQALTNAYNCLYGGEENAYTLINEAASNLESIATELKKGDKLFGSLTDIIYNTQDIAEEIKNLDSSLELDGLDIDRIESRLNQIYRLKIKYNCRDVDALIHYLDEAKSEYVQIERTDEKLEELKALYSEVYREVTAAAGRLSEKRHNGALALDKKIVEELRYLDMERVEFKTLLTDNIRDGKKVYSADGGETAEFLISANAGEELKPLAKISSGGEISRIMLSLKGILAGGDGIGTLIFDEIDTGVSGATASKIGKKLKSFAVGRQVICITHLAQIAAYADSHYKIEKRSDENKTYTTLSQLDESGRRRELARIMGGVDLTEKTLNAADELISKAKE